MNDHYQGQGLQDPETLNGGARADQPSSPASDAKAQSFADVEQRGESMTVFFEVSRQV